MDYQTISALAPDAVRARLQQPMRRLRGSSDGPDAVVPVRRGGFMNQFVRARAMLASSGSGTVVSIKIGRTTATSLFMASVGVLMVAVPLVQTILLAVTKGFVGGVPASALAVVVDPVIWAFVMGANLTSARSEARDLVGLISDALAPGREG